MLDMPHYQPLLTPGDQVTCHVHGQYLTGTVVEVHAAEKRVRVACDTWPRGYTGMFKTDEVTRIASILPMAIYGG